MDVEPSFVINHLLECLAGAMPKQEAADLEPYRRRAAQLGSEARAEWHRAFLCARWAGQVVSLPQHSHLARLVSTSEEAVRLLGDAVATELGRLVPEVGWRVSAGFAAEIAWVDEACRLATEVARDRGWDTVPWRDLLEAVLAVPEGGAQPS